MGWVRSQTRFGAALALLALALQLVLTFGHAHITIVASASISKQAQDFCARAEIAPQQEKACVSARSAIVTDHDDAMTDACAICVVMALAATSIHSSPPALNLPRAVQFRLVTLHPAFAEPEFHRPALQPRAPPAA